MCGLLFVGLLLVTLRHGGMSRGTDYCTPILGVKGRLSARRTAIRDTVLRTTEGEYEPGGSCLTFLGKLLFGSRKCGHWRVLQRRIREIRASGFSGRVLGSPMRFLSDTRLVLY